MTPRACRRCDHAAVAAGVIRATVLLFGPLACGSRTTELVVVIDTDLAVPGELDHVTLSLRGPSQAADPISVNVAAPGAPVFPLTLGLTPAGALSPVSIRVEGLRGIESIVAEDVRTSFVQGATRTLRMLLTLSCQGITCPSDQSCVSGTCGPVDRPGDGLPPWTGAAPPRLDDQPVLIGGRSVWAAGWHSCAAKGATLSCWGRNDDGELGIASSQRVPTRRAVMNIEGPPASVGLGQLHSCVCDHAGQAWCWGNNAQGQLGTGDVLPHQAPVAVMGLGDCVQIAGGGFHVCAVRAGGSVSCWGSNNEGQVGLPAAAAPVTTPQLVPGLSAVVEVRAGERFSCARRTNGTILCWGDNTEGQLGDGTLTSRDAPGRVMNLPSSPSEVVAGRFFACARLGTGHVWCWGENSAGVIGSSPNPAKLPVEISGLDDAVQIATGHQHACALHLTGSVSCWGSNQYGQLGDGTGLNSALPVEVPDVRSDVTSIATGIVHSCARRSSAVYCWGQNILQQLGDGSGADQARPIRVVGF